MFNFKAFVDKRFILNHFPFRAHLSFYSDDAIATQSARIRERVDPRPSIGDRDDPRP